MFLLEGGYFSTGFPEEAVNLISKEYLNTVSKEFLIISHILTDLLEYAMSSG